MGRALVIKNLNGSSSRLRDPVSSRARKVVLAEVSNAGSRHFSSRVSQRVAEQVVVLARDERELGEEHLVLKTDVGY